MVEYFLVGFLSAIGWWSAETLIESFDKKPEPKPPLQCVIDVETIKPEQEEPLQCVIENVVTPDDK